MVSVNVLVQIKAYQCIIFQTHHSANINIDSTYITAKKWTTMAKKIVLFQVILAPVKDECCSWVTNHVFSVPFLDFRFALAYSCNRTSSLKKSMVTLIPNVPKQIISFFAITVVTKTTKQAVWVSHHRKSSIFLYLLL